MFSKIFMFILFFSIKITAAQGGVQNPITIKNDGFKKGVTFEAAMAQVYKKIVPRKSTKTPKPCFWILGDGKLLSVKTLLHLKLQEKPLDIEPMLIANLPKAGEKGEKYLVNKTEKVTFEGLGESIRAYANLAKANGSEPIFMICPSKVDVKEGISMLQLIRKMGIKTIYLATPEKIIVTPPEVPLPKQRPASPHSK